MPTTHPFSPRVFAFSSLFSSTNIWLLPPHRAFNVLFNQLRDNQRALEACTAGWDAHNAPELAWCAGFVSVYMQQYSEAKEWAQRSIALGCLVGGSCQPLEALVPEHAQLPVQSCSWEGPWDVLVWANKGLGDTAGEADALQTQRDAEDARKLHDPKMRLALG